MQMRNIFFTILLTGGIVVGSPVPETATYDINTNILTLGFSDTDLVSTDNVLLGRISITDGSSTYTLTGGALPDSSFFTNTLGISLIYGEIIDQLAQTIFGSAQTVEVWGNSTEQIDEIESFDLANCSISFEVGAFLDSENSASEAVTIPLAVTELALPTVSEASYSATHNALQLIFSTPAQFDQIAEGKKIWNEMIAAFYSKFHNQVELVSETKGKSLGQRSLGVDEKSGKTLYARIGPFGPMIQLGEKSDNEDDPKPKYASLLKGQTIQTISFEEAMKLFDLPRNVGEYKGEEIVAAIGRFGPYLRYNGKFTSIKKTDNEDPLTINLERAIELIEIKIQADKDRVVANFDGSPLVQVLNGRYGVFIQISPEKGKKINVKIPKDKDPKTLSRQDCLDLMENQTKK